MEKRWIRCGLGNISNVDHPNNKHITLYKDLINTLIRRRLELRTSYFRC